MLYKIGRCLIEVYARLMLRLDIQWHASLPEGPVLFAVNHPSSTDPFFVNLLTQQPISVMISAKVFSIPVLGAYMRKMRQIPVVRGQGEHVLGLARQALDEGRSVAIFPEGGISPGRDFHPPRSGVARLALSSGAPVIPVGIYLREDGRSFMPATLEGRQDVVTWYLRGPYVITVGKPMRFSGDANDRTLVRKISETVMCSIRSLVGEGQIRAAQNWA
ncbi:MAG: 1-acyl-sn-glycerol-3-phosphate acyltransferase [Anaerolineales bacterium]|nr:1-acyl-sn-glycerol-3-phosphate acyltransferase [Anaerolineales bacterium]